MIDGSFTGDEWSAAVRLQGAYTDLYLDYVPPDLYAINDWRVNVEGVRGGCFNLFSLNVGGTPLQIQVFGDGRAETTIAGGAPADIEGATGFGPSPAWSRPHTMFEFRVEVGLPNGATVCPSDPKYLDTCEELTDEPMFGAISVVNGQVRVTRGIVGEVDRLPEGADCAPGLGICMDRLVCVEEEIGDRCRCAELPCEPSCTPSREVCNGADDDCDGIADEGGVCACDPWIEICNGVDDDCDGSVDEGSVCDEPEPCDAEPEVCNGFDDDCNGVADEDTCPETYTCRECVGGWRCASPSEQC